MRGWRPLSEHVPVPAAGAIAVINMAWMIGVGAMAAAPLGQHAIHLGVAAAVLSCVLGGFLAAAMTGTRAELTAPSSSICIIYALMASELLAAAKGASLPVVWGAMSVTVMVTGAMLLVASRLDISRWLACVPVSLTAGFMSGIGMLVIVSQVPMLLGLDPMAGSRGPWREVAGQVKPAAVMVGLTAAVAAVLHRRMRLPGHASLTGLLAGAAMHVLLDRFSALAPGATLGTLTMATHADWSLGAGLQLASGEGLLLVTRIVLPFAALMALQAVLNASMTASALERMQVQDVDVNRTLRAQGAANVLCGLLGGLPVCTNAPLSVFAAGHRATRSALMLAALVVFVAGFVLGDSLVHLPLAACAGVLVVSGASMIDPWLRGGCRAAMRGKACNRGALVAGLTVTASCVLHSTALAVVAGLVLALAEFALAMTRASGIVVLAHRVGERDGAALEGSTAGLTVVRATGALFFGNAAAVGRRLEEVPTGVLDVVLDLSRAAVIDGTVAQLLSRHADRLQRGGGRVVLVGVPQDSERFTELAEQGATRHLAAICDDLQHALAWMNGPDASAAKALTEPRTRVA